MMGRELFVFVFCAAACFGLWQENWYAGFFMYFTLHAYFIHKEEDK